MPKFHQSDTNEKLFELLGHLYNHEDFIDSGHVTAEVDLAHMYKPEQKVIEGTDNVAKIMIMVTPLESPNAILKIHNKTIAMFVLDENTNQWEQTYDFEESDH